MAALGVVEPEGEAQSRASRSYALVGVQINLLVLHIRHSRSTNTLSTHRPLPPTSVKHYLITLEPKQNLG